MLRRFSLCALLFLAACGTVSKPPDALRLTPVPYTALPGWQSDSHVDAYTAYARACAVLMQAADKPVGGDDARMQLRDLSLPCFAATQRLIVTNDDARQFFESYFTPYLASNNGDINGLFTGYYQPVLNGSLTRSKRYRYPLYAQPKDGGKLPRAAIESGALRGRGLEIAWVDDAVDLFFLQIQGSGLLRLEDGSQIGIGYAGQNGYPYLAIGKVLRDRGELEKDNVSMVSIKAWLRAHPYEAASVMQANESYVYFKTMEPGDPKGALGSPLLPERSLAADTHFIPLGAPVYMDTVLPDQTLFQRLVIAQDKGGAIKGPVRGDIFFGQGERAELMAGYMKGRGRYFLLLPVTRQL